MMSSVVARRAILLTILLGCTLAFAALWWVSHGGAASWPTVEPAIRRLLEIYLPLLAVLAGFYFAEHGLPSDRQTPVEAFGLAIAIVGIWALLAPAALLLSDTVDAALRVLNASSVLGTSLAASAVAFFFSKSANTLAPARPAGKKRAADMG